MQYEDKISIATPEGIELEFVLAGIGSRLTARLIDLCIIGVVGFLAFLAYAEAASGSSAGDVFVAVVGVIAGFAVLWAYDVLFEAFNAGRTIGKRAMGLRVVGDRGEPVSFATAAVRNLLRLVDEVLTVGLVGLIAILRSSKNQRLGDLAAGTLVVKDRDAVPVTVAPTTLSEEALDRAAGWDTTAVTDEEMIAVRRFLDRRVDLERGARSHLAVQLAERIQPKVAGLAGKYAPEDFLVILAAVKARRR